MDQGGNNKVIYKELSYKIVGTLYNVYNELGFGYQEKTYENAIAECFNEDGINFQRQVPFQVRFKNKIISRNYIDFIVDDKIVLEIKRGDYYSIKNIEQIKKYLAVTDMKLAIMAHFTSKGVKTFRAFNPKIKK